MRLQVSEIFILIQFLCQEIPNTLSIAYKNILLSKRVQPIIHSITYEQGKIGSLVSMECNQDFMMFMKTLLYASLTFESL
jgi:hypothetical protein